MQYKSLWRSDYPGTCSILGDACASLNVLLEICNVTFSVVDHQYFLRGQEIEVYVFKALLAQEYFMPVSC